MYRLPLEISCHLCFCQVVPVPTMKWCCLQGGKWHQAVCIRLWTSYLLAISPPTPWPRIAAFHFVVADILKTQLFLMACCLMLSFLISTLPLLIWRVRVICLPKRCDLGGMLTWGGHTRKTFYLSGHLWFPALLWNSTLPWIKHLVIVKFWLSYFHYFFPAMTFPRRMLIIDPWKYT